MTAPEYDGADDAMAIVNGAVFPDREERQAMIRELDSILSDCVVYFGDDATVYVSAAMDYLDRLDATPGLLHWLLVDVRLPNEVIDQAERDRRIEAEFAALLRADAPTANLPVVLPMTCPAWDAHAREVRRAKPLWWLREAGLLGGEAADDAPCPVCGKPRPKSHRRTR